MPKGPRGEKRHSDVIGNAVHVMRIATGEEPEDREDAPAPSPAQQLGKLGGAARETDGGAEQGATAPLNASVRRSIAWKAALTRSTSARPTSSARTSRCGWQMRRFTRLTNAYSKKAENHYQMVCLYTVWYNFVKMHKTLRCTPAMAAGLSQTLWSMDDIVRLIDA